MNNIMKESNDKEVKIYQEGYDAGIVDADRQCIQKVERLLENIYDRTVDTDTVEDIAYARQIIGNFRNHQKNRK